MAVERVSAQAGKNMQPKIRRELHQITPLRLPNVDKVEA
jgi:hypothetical protein